MTTPSAHFPDLSRSDFKRVALVIPTVDATSHGLLIKEIWQPLGLMALASYARACGFKGEIKIFDQAVMPPETMHAALSAFDPDFVGLSPTVKHYGSALRLADQFRHAKVVFGGRWVTAIAENLLGNHAYVDSVVRYDGEQAFAALLGGVRPEQISNLVFRKASGEVVSNPAFGNPTATLVPVDYSLVDLEAYFSARNAENSGARFERPVSIIDSRGCAYRDLVRANTQGRKEGCSFCCSDLEARYDTPEETWRLLMELKEAKGVDGFRMTGEDPPGNKFWFDRFHATRPKDAPGIAFIYVRASHLVKYPETAGMLAAMETDIAYIGAESGSRRMLGEAAKGSRPEFTLEAVRLLNAQGIRVSLGLVLGMKGESEKSLQETFQMVERLLAFDNVAAIEANIIHVMPGSDDFRTLMKDSSAKARWGGEDVLPSSVITDHWVRTQTTVSPGRLQEFAGQLGKLSAERILIPG